MGLAYRQEEVGNVHGDVHGNAHVGEMKAIRAPNQGNGNEVMRNQLFEIFPRLLQHQKQHDHLLRPVTGLQQIICLEDTLVRLVRESLIHASCVEVPHGRPRHNPQPEWPEDAEV